jgi:hypothetical protein
MIVRKDYWYSKWFISDISVQEAYGTLTILPGDTYSILTYINFVKLIYPSEVFGEENADKANLMVCFKVRLCDIAQKNYR